MDSGIQARIARIATDHTSGASQLVSEAAALLRDVLAAGARLDSVGKQLLDAQPSMAPLWNLVGHALAAQTDPKLFERYLLQLERAPRSLARHAAGLFGMEGRGSVTRVVTLSYSHTVVSTLTTLAAQQPVSVACAEGRPAMEGRRMAAALAAVGTPVELFSDASIAQALDDADAVVVGADAVGPSWFLNKSGTRMLAAAAAQQGIPVYVCATRDKFVSEAIAARLTVRDESPDEIWPGAPAGVRVHNRYFESTPLDLITAVISDLGVLGAALVRDACASPHDALLASLKP